MLKLLSLINGIAIPIVLYFDMVNPILMIIIAVYYLFLLIINLLGVVALGGFYWSKDNVFRDTIQERLKLVMADDVNYNYRMSAILIFEMFALYMIAQMSIVIGTILFFTIIFQALNMYLIKYAMNTKIDTTDDDTEIE